MIGRLSGVAVAFALWSLPAAAQSTGSNALDSERSRLTERLERAQSTEARESAAHERATAESRARIASLRRQLREAKADDDSGPTEAQPPASEPATADSLDAAVERAMSAAETAAEQLVLYLGEIPGTDATVVDVQRALGDLRESDPSKQLAALSTLLSTSARMRADAGTVRATRQTLWSAEGTQAAVELLSVGHAAFAYRTSDGRSHAIALDAPSEARGYRWSAALSAETARQIDATFVSAQAGRQSVVPFPLDVSGQVRVDGGNRPASIRDTFEAGGYVMYPLGAVALIALLLIGERAFVFYRMNRLSDPLSRAVLTHCAAQRFDDAVALCDREGGAVARTLGALLRSRGNGPDAMEDSVQAQLLHELPRLQRRMGGIAILAAVAPLLGLLGTVTGIIQTFRVIRSFGNANPGLLAGGISEALTTTATGLCIAIPVFLVHSLLRGRLDRILSDAERQAATLLGTLREGSSA